VTRSTFVVAGAGRPHELFGEHERAQLFAALHGAPLEQIDPLDEEGLVRGGKIAFVVADAEEGSLVQSTARETGSELADQRYGDAKREELHDVGDGNGLPILDGSELREWERRCLELARTFVDSFSGHAASRPRPEPALRPLTR
jgi:hypothetical protein